MWGSVVSSRKSPNPHQSGSGKDWKMSVDVVVLPTLPPAPNCLVKIWEPLGCPASRWAWKRLREAKPLLEGGEPHSGFALSPHFPEVPSFPFSWLRGFPRHTQHRRSVNHAFTSSSPSPDAVLHKTRLCLVHQRIPRQGHRVWYTVEPQKVAAILRTDPGAQRSLPIPALSEAPKPGRRS